MAGYKYVIERFAGLDQSRAESLLDPSCSPDAMNMDASDGSLAVAKGFAKYLPAPVPQVGLSRIDKLCFFRSSGGVIPMAITGGYVYTYDSDEEEWTRGYSYPLALEKRNYSVLMTRIGMTDVMLIADGVNRILKFDGTEFSLFGSSSGCSDVPVGFIAMYRSRLFAAGDPDNPNRLYYSKLPGSGRTIEDWGADEASPSVEGGHIEIGTTSGDPITSIAAMSNQLLIFKKSSIYRLIGDRPGNYSVELIASSTTPVFDAASTVYRDLIYYVTDGGLHCFNGVDASIMPDARRISGIMKDADTTDTRVAVAGDRLFFTIGRGAGARLIEYDLTLRRYMQYGGFEAHDIITEDGALIIANSTRYLEKWGEGNDFDGVPVEAYWTTPLTDLGDKGAIKTLRELYLRGEAYNCGVAGIEVFTGPHSEEHLVLLRGEGREVSEIPLRNEGRTLKLRISNVNGGRFRILGGVELDMSVRKRTE